MADMSINPLSSTQLASVSDKRPSNGVNNGNGRSFRFPFNLKNLNLKNGTEVDENVAVDTDVVNANLGNEDALRGEEIKAIPKDILLKALKEAGIEQNDETIAVVKALVRENLPLTEKNISTLFLQAYLFKDTPLETLAMMTRLKIPITDENAKQFDELLKGGDNLANKITNLIESLPAEIINNSKNLSELSDLFSKFASLSKLIDTPQTTINGNKPISGGANNNVNGRANTSDLSSSLNQLMEALSERSGDIQSSSAHPNKPLLNNTEIHELINALKAIKAPTSLLNRIININMETMRNPEVSQNINTTTGGTNTKSPIQSAGEEILNIIDRFIQEIDVRTQDETVKRPLRENESPSQARRNRTQRFMIEDIGGRKELFEGVKNLLLNKSFEKITKAVTEEKWFLKPHDINTDEVEGFLSKMNDSLNNFDSHFKETNLNDLRMEARDIRDNVRLINDLNENMTFLQIPLKLSEQVVNSELYVLTKAKKDGHGGTNSSAGGNLNVLLKLKLNNMGSLDIYVNMNGKNIRSKFFSEKDETLAAIREYLPELNSSVAKLGFVFRGSVSKTERGFDFVEDFLNRELPRTEFRRYALHINI